MCIDLYVSVCFTSGRLTGQERGEVETRIRQIRAERGWTVRRLAQESGVDKNTISEAERGLRNPNPITVHKLAGALGVEVSDLFPKAQAALPLEPEYDVLLKEKGFPSEQIAAYLAQNEPELEKMSAKVFLENLLAEPGFRRTYEHYRKTDTEPSAPRSESA